MRLNQALANVQALKVDTQKRLTQAHHLLQKTNLLGGVSRTYYRKDEEGEELPPENQLVQLKTPEVLAEQHQSLAALFDAVGRIDYTNTLAAADITVGETTLLAGVPTTHLLFLEKQLDNLLTFLRGLPTLDPEHAWEWDGNLGLHTTQDILTTRSKKILHNHLVAPATQHHPAQVQTYGVDQIVGTWHTRKLSGALTREKVKRMVRNCQLLIAAVKSAIQEANTIQAQPLDSGSILGFVFDA